MIESSARPAERWRHARLVVARFPGANGSMTPA
ncbi:gp132a [Mycobacterium phage Omega]|nr:gp132a [Mycobacterium phage Omega]